MATLTALIAMAFPVVGNATAPATRTALVALTGWTTDGDLTTSAPVTIAAAVALSADWDATTTDEVAYRTRTRSLWSVWVPLVTAPDDGPDPVSAEGARVVSGASELAWLGDVDAVQVRTDGPAEDLRVTAVDVAGGAGIGFRPSDLRRGGVAEAAAYPPRMVPRTAWDPNGDCRPRVEPEVAPKVERVFVHHTVIFSDYAPEESDDIVRAICVNHVARRGFDDLGYNFMIDRYGTVFQGRAGGVLRGVVGAHAAGFNVGSVGIALIGDFQTGDVTQAATDALDELVAWLMDFHGLDPFATSVATSTGGATTRYPEGTPVELPTILGHRDTGTGTACPGDFLYTRVRGELPIAPRVAARMQPAPAAEAPVIAAEVAPAAPVVVEPEVPVELGPVAEPLRWLVRGLVTTRRIAEAMADSATSSLNPLGR